MSIYEAKPFEAATEDVSSLKRSYAALSGWIKRKNIQILDNAQPGAYFVSYRGRFMETKAWYFSPKGREDSDLVRRYMETKALLKKLGEI
ncbi:MAG: hypothetical protein ACFE89_02835 [Candidatus Hodarchaeota archaeon]